MPYEISDCRFWHAWRPRGRTSGKHMCHSTTHSVAGRQGRAQCRAVPHMAKSAPNSACVAPWPQQRTPATPSRCVIPAVSGCRPVVGVCRRRGCSTCSASHRAATEAFTPAQLAHLLRDKRACRFATEPGLFGQTLLHVCAHGALPGHAEAAAQLLRCGADVAARTAHGGWSPLHYAARRGGAFRQVAPSSAVTMHNSHMMMMHASGTPWQRRRDVQLLLDSGADVNQEDAAGEPPAFGAAREGHADVLALLLHSGGAHHPAVIADRGALHDWLAHAQRRREEWRQAQEAVQRLPRSMSGMFQQ